MILHLLLKIEKNKDVLEEMTILELKLSREIKEIKENIDKGVDAIYEDTNTRIKNGIQKGTRMNFVKLKFIITFKYN